MRTWRETNRPTQQQRWKTSARAYARVYEQRGKLIRTPCEVCQDPDVERHHDDYNKPLAVRYLCKKHHRARHATAGD